MSEIPSRSFLPVALLATFFSCLAIGVGFLLSWLEIRDFCYALDDSFIMMAISKNIAEFGVWGTSPHEFAGAASSPLFTVLLAGLFFLLGTHIWIPLAINLVAHVLLFIWLGKTAERWGFRPWQIWVLLMGITLLAPLPVLVWGSMEHILQIGFSLFCIERAVNTKLKTSTFLWFLLGILVAGIRYEGLFLGGAIVLWHAYHRQWAKGIFLGFGLVLPMTVLGVYSMTQGGYFLPNSLVLKGFQLNILRTGSVGGFLYSWLSKVTSNPHAIAAMLLLALSIDRRKLVTSPAQQWIGFALWMSIAHFCFAMYGHVFRYEAYLMAVTWVALWKFAIEDLKLTTPSAISRFLFPEWKQTALVLLLLYPILLRSAESMAVGSRAMVNIYEQQVQMGRFVHRYYNQAPLVATDIGAICYLAQPHLIDAFGLATLEVAKAKMNNTYSFYFVDSLCRKKGVEAAVIYSNKIDTTLWHKAGCWIISNNAVCVKDTVDFFGLNLPAAHKIQREMMDFQSLLPKSVRVFYYPLTPKTNPKSTINPSHDPQGLSNF